MDENTTHNEQDENTKLTNAERWERLEAVKEDRVTRKWLMHILLAVSLVWLLYMLIGLAILALQIVHLSEMVATAFITTTNAWILGSWAIGLRYFFSTRV